jgi:hypothetical protein
MRLKLGALIVLVQTECLCPGGHELSFNTLAPPSGSPAA